MIKVTLPKYWVACRLPDGKQEFEKVGTSLTDAQALDGKRKGQKKERKLFDVKPDHKLTYQELTD